MAAALRQLLRLKPIPSLGYARRPAPPPPPAAPLGLIRTFASGSTSNAAKAPRRTWPGMYHWRHGKMIPSDVHVRSMDEKAIDLWLMVLDYSLIIGIPLLPFALYHHPLVVHWRNNLSSSLG